MAYQEGNKATTVCDPVPLRLTYECVHTYFCLCHLVGPHPQGWHHLGALYSNVVSRRHQLVEKRCGCSQVEWQFLSGCIKNIKDQEMSFTLSRIVKHVLTDVPPPVPQRGEPLVSALTSRKFKPKLERARLR